MELTLVSYNIHSGIGGDGKFDLDRVVEVIQEARPDLVALQEVGDSRGVTPREDHPEYLARRLGLQMAFGPNVVRGGRRYGNAVLSRMPILASRNYDLSVPGRESRGALRCDIDLGSGKPLHLFCVHLGLSDSERRAQESLLLSADILQDSARAHPVVVCGDFNYWRDGQVPALVRSAIHDAQTVLRARAGRTYPARFPLFRLDRVFVDEGVRPISLQAHRSALARRASDHLPVVMRFEAPIEVSRPKAGTVQMLG